MSNKTPDRASDFDDIPTYGDDQNTTIYRRAGRVAPQNIEPEPTQVFEREPVDRSAPLASDAPVEPYADQDYAPTGANPAVPAAASTTYQSAEHSEVVATETEVEQAAALGASEGAKRGTIDFGLLLLRVVLAAWLLFDSITVFFGIGGRGLGSLENDFGAYVYPNLLSIAIPTVELAAGVFLLFGLLTPIAAALATVATSFLFLHQVFLANGEAFASAKDTLFFYALLAAISVVVQFTGPGIISLDTSRSWARRPLASSWFFVIAAIAGAIALWWFGAAVNPIQQ
ncbi:DoxX family protein [Corynebacterium gerontici]|uniref:DoxX n=1 Tax=Corynebacterium gerontici TaxID=2079234 RepID=A0A3G6IZR1_9CORY|nr:DoxX family protein [Corynebacterium gerontici]AZA11281.1 DoxX [Corynebacterium gerontici]